MPSSSSFRPDAMVGYVAELRCCDGGGYCEHGGNGWRWGRWAWTPLDGVGCYSGGPEGRGLIAPSPLKEHTLCLVADLLHCLEIRTFVPSTSHVVFNYARLFEHNIFCKVVFQVATAPLDVRASAAEVCKIVSSKYLLSNCLLGKTWDPEYSKFEGLGCSSRSSHDGLCHSRSMFALWLDTSSCLQMELFGTEMKVRFGELNLFKRTVALSDINYAKSTYKPRTRIEKTLHGLV
ncbi:hypothetical protein KC19_VG140700 [Ceratodon purpureus]|uniref:Uncharacterized protein n=1 Tax=Ceratodon purpureus TaxID=3225 RepID=A0A8T0HQD6_CERPU|nr:hypothetical protein KC19_VG140700 [Ceratodon purpureus]